MSSQLLISLLIHGFPSTMFKKTLFSFCIDSFHVLRTFKVIEYSSKLNLVQSYITLVPYTIPVLCQMKKNKKDFIEIKRKIRGYIVSDQSRAQEERQTEKWAKGIIYVCISCHVSVHRTSSIVVQSIVRKINTKGFKLNIYYRCLENKMVNGKQFTLLWYVEDFKVLHMKTKVVGDLINYLKIILDSYY